MGCDIHTRAEKRNGDRWISIGYQPFDWRSYGMFAFLAGVRNYSGVTPIAEPRGLPPDTSYVETDDDWLGEHSFSWLSLDELLAFDYDYEMEDRRVTRQTGPNLWDAGCTCASGEGVKMTYREFLGARFFDDLERLRNYGAERIVFGFDS